MKVWFKLFQRFILRALTREKLRSGFTTLGISLGVSVMIAIRLANLSALDSFKAATEAITGDTSIQITGTAGRFDETKLLELGWLRDYGQISPVIEGYAQSSEFRIEKSTPQNSGVSRHESTKELTSQNQTPNSELRTPNSNDFLHILGVDILRDHSIRKYQLLQTNATDKHVTTRDFLLLLTDPESIIITEKFARKHSLEIGGKLSLVIGDTPHTFTIRGLLRDEGPARALDGNFALLDIAAAQLAFNRLGFLDRLDVKLKSNVTLEKAEAEIASKLPTGLTVTRPSSTYDQVEKMIAAFHFNLSALGSIALLVGLFLIYNTISISVLSRRAEVGTLRAIGTSRKTILSLFLGEAILLALIGTIIGLGLGRLLATAAVKATATTVDTFYIATAAIESAARHSLTWFDVVLAFAVALPLSLAAAALPALEASRVRPVEAIRGAERLASGFHPSRKYIFIALALLATGYLFSRFDAINGLPLFGYLSAITIMFGGAFLVPHALLVACRFVGNFIGRIVRRVQVEAKLAGANLRGAIPRVSISVAALSVSLAMMVSISIMIGSFRDTVSYWVDQSLVADLFARPLTRNSITVESEINEEAIRLLKTDPSVDAVYTYASQPLTYQGNLISFGSSDFSVFAKHGNLLFKAPTNGRERMLEAIGQDAVVVTESFSLLFKKGVDDSIELPTVSGSHTFKIYAVYYDYSNNRGTVVMDYRTHDKYFPSIRPTNLSIYLKPGANADEVRDRLASTIGNRFQLIITTNKNIRSEVIRIFNSTFAITYALELIAIVVAGLGVISTLITLILERRNELAMLTFLGASRAQIRRMIVIEALLIGLVSEVVGAFIGTLLSLVLIYVINVQSFGWTIQFHFPMLFLLQSAILILLVTALAGLYPATRAANVEALNYE